MTQSAGRHTYCYELGELQGGLSFLLRQRGNTNKQHALGVGTRGRRRGNPVSSCFSSRIRGDGSRPFWVSRLILLKFCDIKSLLRGGPDDTGGVCFSLKKKLFSKSDKNIVCSPNCKKTPTQLAEKWGYVEGGFLFLCLRGKIVCFWFGARKQICTGTKTISPPTYHLVRLLETTNLPAQTKEPTTSCRLLAQTYISKRCCNTFDCLHTS